MSSTREEFDKEADALVGLISGMIDSGQLSDAAQLIEQYALLNPADTRITGLRERCSGLICPQSPQGDSPRASGNAPESIFIVASLIRKRSGFYTSIFNKTRLLEEHLGYSSSILTCRHDIDLRKTEVWLKTFTGSSEILSPKTGILNVYEYYQKSYADGLENKAIYSRMYADEIQKYTEESEGIYNAYVNDALVRQDVYCGYMGSLRLERFFEGDKKTREVYYDDWGYLNCVREYDLQKENIYTAKYYTTGGKLCIEAFFDNDINDMEPQEILLYNEDSTVKVQLGSNEELAALYLMQIMKNAGDDVFYMLVFETGTVAKISDWLSEEQGNFAKVSIIHSIFLKNAYNPNSGPQSYYEYVCNNPGKMDGIVFLTETERRDFTDIYKRKDGLFVIPHPYPYDIEPVSFEQRDSRRAVVISRLFPEKQIDLTVDIFCMVVKAIPDAKLDIYGIGPEQEAIEDYIKKRGMEGSVTLKGYTDDAISIYRTAALHIFTSIAEGYGLTLMESICNGCPAFAYDIKYGPSDIIDEGKTGFLFPLGEKKKFADKIISYLQDTDMQREMSDNCYAAAAGFSREAFIDKWMKMTGDVCNGKIKT